MDDRDLLGALIGDRAPADDVALRHRDGRAYLVVRNEFASVWITIERRPNGIRLLITDAATESALALDPLELEAISRMQHRDFDERILERDPQVSVPPTAGRRW